MNLTAKEILEKNDLPIRCVSCPEWGGHIWVKALDANGLVDLQDSFANDPDKGEVLVRTVAATACDEQGNLLFDSKPETIAALRKKSGAVMLRLFNASRELSGIEVEADELVKN